MYQNKIRLYREEIGMSPKELAISSKISLGYLCHLERGTRKNPSIAVMERISKGLGKDLAEVFFGSNQ